MWFNRSSYLVRLFRMNSVSLELSLSLSLSVSVMKIMCLSLSLSLSLSVMKIMSLSLSLSLSWKSCVSLSLSLSLSWRSCVSLSLSLSVMKICVLSLSLSLLFLSAACVGVCWACEWGEQSVVSVWIFICLAAVPSNIFLYLFFSLSSIYFTCITGLFVVSSLWKCLSASIYYWQNDFRCGESRLPHTASCREIDSKASVEDCSLERGWGGWLWECCVCFENERRRLLCLWKLLSWRTSLLKVES